MNSPDTIRTRRNEATGPSPWFALLALLTAPLVAAIFETGVYHIGARFAGYRPASPPFDGLEFVYFGFALVFIPLGGLVMFVFWRRAPFSPLLGSTFGAGCGALVGLIAILSYENRSLLLVAAALGPGVAGGVAGGLTIWLICRLGSRERHG